MNVHALISEIFYVHEFADKNLIEQEAHGPHCSPEKTVQINKHIR